MTDLTAESRASRRAKAIARHRARWCRLTFLLIGIHLMTVYLMTKGGAAGWEAKIIFATKFALLPTMLVLMRKWPVHLIAKVLALALCSVIGLLLYDTTYDWVMDDTTVFLFVMRPELKWAFTGLAALIMNAPLLALCWYAPRLPAFTLRTSRLT